jgi:hypothetical protein
MVTARTDGPRSEALILLLGINGLRITEALSRDIEHFDHDQGGFGVDFGSVGGEEGGLGHGALADGVAVEAGDGRDPSADGGRGEVASGVGVAGFVEYPDVDVSVVDASPERIDAGSVAEAEPRRHVGPGLRSPDELLVIRSLV